MPVDKKRKMLLAVTGQPVSHSISPFLFNTFFTWAGIQARYTRLAFTSAKEACLAFRQLGLTAMNVTKPFKQEMFHLIEDMDEAAARIKGINTLINDQGRIKGYNTDYLGVVQPLKKRNLDLKEQNCLVIGAGGAARAAVYGLLQGKARVTIVNRTWAKAAELADYFGCSAIAREKILQDIKDYPVIINTLPHGVHLVLPEDIPAGTIYFDANYAGKTGTGKANSKGCRVIGGEEWLLNQALPLMHHFSETEVDEEALMAQTAQKNTLYKQKNHIILVGENREKTVRLARSLAKKIGIKFMLEDNTPLNGQKEKIPGEYVKALDYNQAEAMAKTKNGFDSAWLAGLIDLTSQNFSGESTLRNILYTLPFDILFSAGTGNEDTVNHVAQEWLFARENETR